MDTLDQLYKIGTIQAEDIPTLAQFQAKMAWETEEYKLDTEAVEQGIQALLDDPSKGRYYKFLHEGDLVGCLMTTYEWSEWRNGQVLWIQSLYILPEHRGKGLFRKVYQYLQDQVKETEGWRGIRLYVDKRNQAATEVYKSIGMDNSHYELFEWMNS